MQKKRQLNLMIAGIVLSVGLIVTTTQATNDNFDTDVSISFLENTTPIDPVNPLNPDPSKPVVPIDPLNPDKPSIPGVAGALTIDFASTLDFGKQRSSIFNKQYYATAQYFSSGVPDLKKGYPNYVQVSDRRGFGAGWTLTVTQRQQLKTADNHKLTGATIKIIQSFPDSITTDTDAPMATDLSGGLVPQLESTVMSSTQGGGKGTWVDVFGAGNTINQKKRINKAVALEVPGSTTKYAQTYRTSLIWKLSDTPLNE